MRREGTWGKKTYYWYVAVCYIASHEVDFRGRGHPQSLQGPVPGSPAAPRSSSSASIWTSVLEHNISNIMEPALKIGETCCLDVILRDVSLNTCFQSIESQNGYHLKIIYHKQSTIHFGTFFTIKVRKAVFLESLGGNVAHFCALFFPKTVFFSRLYRDPSLQEVAKWCLHVTKRL